MIDITAIEDALYAWVNGVTGLPTIFANQNAPRPETAYCLINLLQNTSLGWGETELTLLGDNSVDIDRSTPNELMVSINAYYPGAYGVCTKLKDSLQRITVQDDLFAAGVGYLRTGDIRDIPEVVDVQWEERAQFDCFFFVRSLDEENIESIQKIELTNNLDGDTIIIEK